MPRPKVHSQSVHSQPSGENAGAAVGGTAGGNGQPGGAGVEPATVKEIEDAGGSPSGRSNPSGSASNGGGGKPAWLSVVEDLLKVGGKELWSATKEYVKEGNLSLFTRRNPTEGTPQQESSGPEADPDAPKVPPPDHFDGSRPNKGHLDTGRSNAGRRGANRRNGTGHREASGERSSGGQPTPGTATPGTGEGTDMSPNPPPAANVDLTPGDIARVEVGNSVVWAEVTGRAGGRDDYEGRLAHPALGMAEGAPVTFAKRHLLGREQQAPLDPTPETPEGIAGKRVRENPSDSGGPLPPRF